jgi:hypothetical protein
MQAQDSRSAPSERLAVAYTDRPVSGWGGLVAVVRYFDRRGVRALLERALPDGRTSPNQIPVVDMVLSLLAAVLTGARRFAHVERIRGDETVRGILGVKRPPSAMSLTRYFGGFVRRQVEHLDEVLWSFTLQWLRAPMLGMTLDLDSTVFERYGHQEGSLKGHNPRKHGRPSHHPLLAMLAEAKVVAHAWLRSGNASSARGVVAFLDETLARLGDGFRLYALRADSGFFFAEFLAALEARDLPYTIVVRMTPHIQRTVAAIKTWTPFAQGLEVGEVNYQAPGWKQERRMVVVREEIRERPEARGRKLFDVPGYTFHTVVTTLALPAADVWRFYNARADCENRLKELKEDFAANGFCLKSFDGTEAVFRLICFLFNVIAAFKHEIMANESPRLMTLRTDVLVVGATLGADGRKPVLRLGLRGKFREHFAELLARIAAMSPTVAQLANLANGNGSSAPSRWRPRRRRGVAGALAGLAYLVPS